MITLLANLNLHVSDTDSITKEFSIQHKDPFFDLMLKSLGVKRFQYKDYNNMIIFSDMNGKLDLIYK